MDLAGVLVQVDQVIRSVNRLSQTIMGVGGTTSAREKNALKEQPSKIPFQELVTSGEDLGSRVVVLSCLYPVINQRVFDDSTTRNP